MDLLWGGIAIFLLAWLAIAVTDWIRRRRGGKR